MYMLLNGVSTIFERSVMHTLQGDTVVTGDRSGTIEHTAINSEGEASMYRIDAPYIGIETQSVQGLSMVGVMRRQRILRSFVECEPESIKIGDMVILEDVEGNRLKTLKAKGITKRSTLPNS
jgi:hypothetical protein